MALVLKEIMSKRLKTANINTSLEEALTLLQTDHIRHLLVLEENTGKLLGLVSDRDVKKLLSPFVGTPKASTQDNATLRVKVGAIMRRELVTGEPHDTVKTTIEIMLQRKLSCIPVVDEHKRALGIITTDDVMKTLLRFL